MSKEYRTIRIPEGVFAELEGVKREGETWEGLMRRLLDGNDQPKSETWKMTEIDWPEEELERFREEFRESVENLPERTADELEGRMR